MVTKPQDSSRNPLPAKAKKTSGELALGLTADLSVLYGHIKTAHWNLHGTNFLGLHRLLDEVAAFVIKSTDEAAERARQLGQTVDGNLSALAKASELSTFPGGIVDGKTVCEELGSSMAYVIDQLRSGIEKVDEAGDPITADLLTKISGGLELQLWLLESHLP